MKNTLLKPLVGFRMAAVVLVAAVLICSAAVISSQHFFASQTQATPRPPATSKLSPSPSPLTTPTAQVSSSQATALQVQLANYADGFLFSVVVPQNQLPADPFNPPV